MMLNEKNDFKCICPDPNQDPKNAIQKIRLLLIKINANDSVFPSPD